MGPFVRIRFPYARPVAVALKGSHQTLKNSTARRLTFGRLRRRNGTRMQPCIGSWSSLSRAFRWAFESALTITS